MKYRFYMNGVRLCPKCSAMMVQFGGEVRYRCVDCGTRYEVVGIGCSDKELVLEEMGSCRNENLESLLR